MKTAVIFAAFFAVAYAQGYADSISSSGYSAPAPVRSFNAAPARNNGGGGGYDNAQETPYVKQVYKHVYVHEAPEEPIERKSNVIRVPGGDKHVNIIFVKTPSQSSSQQTEVILPEQDEHKNLVYVLLKKGENNNNVKITRPQPQAPSKPEVNFIRYSQPEAQPQPEYGAPSSGSGSNFISAPIPAVRDVQPPSNTYGQPSF